MRQTNPKTAAFIGTCLEYYDMSLYGMLLPVLVGIFLPHMEKTQALLLSSLMLPLSLFARPFGALFIGKVGDKYGRKNALIIGIVGMAVVTGLTGLLPSYNQIGILAPILFIVLRTLQSFFVAGEYNGGAIFILEHSDKSRKGYISGLYCFFTVIGISFAAIISSIISPYPKYWRVAYLIGATIGFFGIYIRKYVAETPEFISARRVPPATLTEISKKWRSVGIAIGVASFFSSLYSISTLFMNAFIPLATDISVPTILRVNSVTTLIYMVSLPIMGFIADKITIARSMSIAAFVVAILAYPLLQLIQYNNLNYIILMKAIFAFLAGWYVGPFHAWIQDVFTTKERYRAISFCYSIGSQLGNLMMPLGLWIWKETGSYFYLSLPLGVFAILAIISLEVNRRRAGIWSQSL